jgi:hypothetical protein
MKKFKRGDLVEHDFAVGLVLETGSRSDGSKRNEYHDTCKVMFCDGIEWKETRHLHTPPQAGICRDRILKGIENDRQNKEPVTQ